MSNGFRYIQWRMWRSGWRDLDTTSKQRSMSFTLVPIDFYIRLPIGCWRQFLFRQALFRHFKSSSASPVCFNVDADHTIKAPLNTRRSRLPGGGTGWLAARAWNALPSSATAKTITYLLVW